VAQSIFITSAEGHSGKSTIALGVLDALSHATPRVGVFRAIARSTVEPDYVLEMLLAHDGVDLPYEDCIGVTYDEVRADPDAALGTIVERYKAVEAQCDAVVIIGSDYTDVGSPAELGYNARIAANLGVAWHTANDAVLTEGHRRLINDPARFDGVAVLGVDEHVWRHTRFGDKYVTVIIDLTPVRDGVGPARLLDMIPGRSKAVFKTWLSERHPSWSQRIEVVAMDGFTGFKTAAAEELPAATAVMDPFHVVKLAGDALDQCRRRIQQAIHGHRGHAGDPLYMSRRVLHTGLGLLTDRQWARLDALFDTDAHAEVEVTWSVYQRMITAYRNPDRAAARTDLADLIESLRTGVPAALVELRRLGRTLNHRKADVLAFFDRPGTSNGPTEAINGRLEHLRGSALGFRNLHHYIARALLEAGGFRPLLHP